VRSVAQIAFTVPGLALLCAQSWGDKSKQHRTVHLEKKVKVLMRKPFSRSQQNQCWATGV
jgi:hypothetical protein